jgi:hypothetical protein
VIEKALESKQKYAKSIWLEIEIIIYFLWGSAIVILDFSKSKFKLSKFWKFKLPAKNFRSSHPCNFQIFGGKFKLLWRPCFFEKSRITRPKIWREFWKLVFRTTLTANPLSYMPSSCFMSHHNSPQTSNERAKWKNGKARKTMLS